MITLRINTARKLVDEGGGVLPATDRPELAAGIKYYDIELIPAAGVAAGTYTLSGDIEFRRVNTMFQATATVETGEPLRFRVSTDTLGFWEKMRCRQPGTVLYIRCTAATADGDAVSVLEDRIYARPGVAGSGDVPAPTPGAVTDINGLSGAVKVFDADGALVAVDVARNALILPAGGGGGGGTGPRSPQMIVSDMMVRTELFGECWLLGARLTTITPYGWQRDLASLQGVIASSAAGYTGDVVLRSVVAGVAQEAVVVPVGIVPAPFVLPCPVDFARITIERVVDDPRDTLTDELGDKVDAAILYLEPIGKEGV